MEKCDCPEDELSSKSNTLTRNELAGTRINCKTPETMNSKNEMKKYLDVLDQNWNVEKIGKKWHLKREFIIQTKSVRKSKKLQRLKAISDAIFQVTKKSNYHPDILINGVKKLTVDIYSHKMRGLREAEFVFAARIDVAIQQIPKE
eukprot:863239_1